MLFHHRGIVELAKRRVSIEECVRIVEFDQPATVKHGYLVEIEDRVEFVRNGDDGVGGEFLADHALHYFVRLAIDAVGKRLDFGGMVSGGMVSGGIVSGVSIAYLLVASSRMRMVLERSIALARQKSCFCP